MHYTWKILIMELANRFGGGEGLDNRSATATPRRRNFRTLITIIRERIDNEAEHRGYNMVMSGKSVSLLRDTLISGLAHQKTKISLGYVLKSMIMSG